jgi:hypothetical protein
VMEVAANEQLLSKLRRRGDGFPKGFSGNPKGKAALKARSAELFGIMAPDFAPLSATDEVLLRQACLLLARSERIARVRDIDVGVRMSGEARRLLQALRKNAPAPAVPAERFTEIAVKAQAEEDARRAAELAGDAVEAGHERIDHPNRSGHHDDLANACAGALWRCSTERRIVITPEFLARAYAMPPSRPQFGRSRWPMMLAFRPPASTYSPVDDEQKGA